MNERINMIDIKRELADIGEEIKEAVAQSFDDTMFINGPRVKAFETAMADYLGVKYAIGVANGTEALHLGLRAIGVEAGDEVITTAFTFFATAEACAYIGAKPVFVDVEEGSMNIDPNKIEAAITPKTKVILPVHIFGAPANMPKIMEIAAKHKLMVFEDCAQSIGAEIGGKKTGSIGKAAAFSFYPTKNLGAYGDAGMITTNDEKVANLAKRYREHGSSERYYHDLIGYNSRLDDIQAAILAVKIKYVDRFNKTRKALADEYLRILDSIGVQKALENSSHVYHQFTVRLKNRTQAVEALNRENIASAIFYPVPCHLQKSMSYLGYKEGSLPVTEKLAKEVLSLPMNPYLTKDEIERIAKIVKEAV